MEFTLKEIILAAIGSSGVIGGLGAAFVFVTGRLDARRKRLDAAADRQLHDSIEVKKLNAEVAEKESDKVVQNLWKIIEAERLRCTELEKDLDDCEKESTFNRPKITQIYKALKAADEELNHMHVMVFNQEETNVFVKRLGAAREQIAVIRDLMP